MHIINCSYTNYYIRRKGNIRQKQGGVPAELGIDTKMKKNTTLDTSAQMIGLAELRRKR